MIFFGNFKLIFTKVTMPPLSLTRLSLRDAPIPLFLTLPPQHVSLSLFLYATLTASGTARGTHRCCVSDVLGNTRAPPAIKWTQESRHSPPSTAAHSGPNHGQIRAHSGTFGHIRQFRTRQNPQKQTREWHIHCMRRLLV